MLLESDHLVDGDRDAPSLDHNLVEVAKDQPIRPVALAGLPRGLGDHGVDAIGLGPRLHPGRQIHVVPHHGVVESRAAAHVADHRGPRVETDAGLHVPDDFRPAVSLGLPLRSQVGELPLHPLGRNARAQRMIRKGNGRTEHGDHGVADVLVECPPLLLHDIRAGREVFVHQFHQSRRRELLREAGESLNITEVGRDLLLVSTELGIFAGLDHALDQLGRNIGSEHALDASLGLLLLDHLQEQRGEAGRKGGANRDEDRQHEVKLRKNMKRPDHVGEHGQQGDRLGKDRPRPTGDGEQAGARGEQENDSIRGPLGQAHQVLSGDNRLQHVAVEAHLRHRLVIKRGGTQILQQQVNRADQHDRVLELIEELAPAGLLFRILAVELREEVPEVRDAGPGIARGDPRREPVHIDQLAATERDGRHEGSIRPVNLHAVLEPLHRILAQAPFQERELQGQRVERAQGRLGKKRSRPRFAAVGVDQADNAMSRSGNRKSRCLRRVIARGVRETIKYIGKLAAVAQRARTRHIIGGQYDLTVLEDGAAELAASDNQFLATEIRQGVVGKNHVDPDRLDLPDIKQGVENLSESAVIPGPLVLLDRIRIDVDVHQLDRGIDLAAVMKPKIDELVLKKFAPVAVIRHAPTRHDQQEQENPPGGGKEF